MASPQLENGFTRIANEILEALSKAPLSGSEFRLAISILRYTYGMQKKSAEITTQTLRKTTNLISSRLSEAKKNLIKRGILFVTKKRNRLNATYEFNKNYDGWNSLRKNVTLRKNVKDVTEKRNSGGVVPLVFKESIKDKTPSVKYTELFLIFYRSYPLKKSKAAAYKAWKKIKDPESILPTILDAIKNQKAEKEHKKSRGEFCPEWKHPATWLNGECWEDEVDIKPGQEMVDL